VDDIITTTTNVDFTAGYTYFSLAFIPVTAALGKYRVFFEQGGGTTCFNSPAVNDSLYLIRRVPSNSFVQKTGGGAFEGRWAIFTGVCSPVAGQSEIYLDRSLEISGTMIPPSASAVLRFGRATFTTESAGGMDGCVSADYFAPPGLTPTQMTEMYDYMAARHGVVL
jgi:hypothetical protein